MAKETEPTTYRISPEVDAELRRLAKIHGGVDKALRGLLGWVEGPPVDKGFTIPIETHPVPDGLDPRTIPGISVGPPKTEGQFRCRCIHTGCRGAYFKGTSRFQTLCDVCLGLGHSGDPRSCKICYEDSGLA